MKMPKQSWMLAEMNTKGMELDGEIKIDIDFEEPTL